MPIVRLLAPNRLFAPLTALVLLLPLLPGASGTALAAVPAAPPLQQPTPAAAERVARLRVLLMRQDYAAAGADMRELLKQRASSDAERALIYQWLLAHEDLAELDRRSRAALASGQALAADRLA
ncbi:MAG: hypothetical protein ABW005_10885, partial [Burkholderiaceae bacterium]